MLNIRIIGAAAGNFMATIMTIQVAKNKSILIPIVRPMTWLLIVCACQMSNAQARADRKSSPPRIRERSRCRRGDRESATLDSF